MMNGSIPSPTASKEEKAKKEYGLQYAGMIWADYNKDISVYNARRKQIIINRQYAEGMQSVQKYKNLMDLDGDSSYVNLDFSPISRVPTIVDNIVGKLMNQSFKIQCNPIDSESLTQYDEYRRKLYANMFLAKIAEPIEEVTGIPVIPLGEKILKSKDDVEMHLRLNYKMDAAMSMESAIDWVNRNNLFEDTRRRIVRDLIVIKKAALYRYYDSAKNIRHEYIDPADLIYPYSKYDDFRNIPYVGVLKQYQLWEIAAQNPEFTEQELFDIARTYAGKNKNPTWNWGGTYEGYYRSNSGSQPYRNFNISVLEFYFVCTNTEKRVKKKSAKGVTFFEEKPNTYSLNVNPNTIQVVDLGKEWGVKGEKLTVSKDEQTSVEDARVYFAEIKTNRRKENVELIEKSAKYVYEGKWIPDSDYLYGYKMQDNIPRKRVGGSYSPEAELPIDIIAPNIYDMENKSIVERLIPLADQMVLAHLRFQQLLIKAVPPGVFIDTDALNGVITAAGEGTKPIDILRMYQQTGSVVGSSTREDGSVINGRFVENLPNGIGKDFQAYIATQQHYMQLMNDVIGFNSAVDASSPNTDALVGVQKMAAQATQNALRPYYDAHLNLILRSTEKLALMIQDSAEYNWEAFSMALGEQAADTLRYGRKIAFNQFAIDVEIAPDEEEKYQIDQLIQMGLANGTLMVSDAIRIRQELKSSAKLASQLLIMLENKNKEDKMNESMQLQAQNAQVQQQSAQVSSQMKQQEMQLEVQMKTALIQAEYAAKDAFEQAQLQRDMMLQQLKNEGAYTVAEINSDGKVNVQAAANQGKVVAQQVASQSNLQKESMRGQSEITKKRMEQMTKLQEKEIENETEDND
jgi:hypothetical protein